MDPKCRSVLDAALELPEADRAVIVETLLATLAPEAEGPTDDAAAAETDRRAGKRRGTIRRRPSPGPS